MLTDRETDALIAAASHARLAAYAPYSHFQVGAVVVGADDRLFVGCNVENASYGLSLCAERAALSAAVAAGTKRARAVVVVTEAEPPGTPCGACRQWLREFGDDDLEVVCANTSGTRLRFRLADLLPHPFVL